MMGESSMSNGNKLRTQPKALLTLGERALALLANISVLELDMRSSHDW